MASWDGHGRFWTVASSRQKGGEEIGLAEVGNGTKRMLVTDANGIPLALLIAGANRKGQRKEWEEEYKERWYV